MRLNSAGESFYEGAPVSRAVRLLSIMVSALLTATVLGVATTPAASARDIQPLPDIPDTVGTSFWLTFPDLPSGLGATVSGRFLYVSPSADGSVTLSKADGSDAVTQPVSRGTVTTLSLPTDFVTTAVDGVEQAGARLTSTVPVSVYGAAIADGGSTGFQALPDDTLGTSYRVLGYTALAGNPAGRTRLTVIGTAADTTLTITPRTTIGSRAAGVPFSQVIGRGETYQLASGTNGADVTGTTVTSDKPVAVLGGSSCSNVPGGFGYCNPLLQQMPPTAAWGTDFVTTRFATRKKGDTYRVLADQNATVVSINGDVVATLDAGEFYETVQPPNETTAGKQAVVFKASKPVLVAQYGNGQTYDNTTGDPIMMLVTPTGQHLTSYTVTAPAITSQGAPMTPYVNLVVQTRDIGTITLDGTPVPASDFTAAPGTDYSVAQLQVSTGQHTFTSSHQFGVQVYLWGLYDGLGFPGGSAIAPIADANDPPTAAPLTSQGPGPRSVTVPVGEQQEVRLLDGVTLVDEVEIVDQGTYQLDRSTGVITFTPVAGFSGPATPVTYRIVDAWNQQAESTFTPTVDKPAPPTASPLTSSGRGVQSVSLSLDAGVTLALLDGTGTETASVAVPTGQYLLDASTSTISYVPDAGTSGRPTPVKYRLTDAFNQTAESTYSPDVLASPVVPSPPKPDPRADLQVKKRVVVSSGKKASVPVTCAVRNGTASTCKVTLTATVHGSTTVVGRGTSRPGTKTTAKVRVKLNAVGRSLAATPNGRRFTAQMVVKTGSGATLHGQKRTRVVARSFTLARPVYFGFASAKVGKADRGYLRRVGKSLGPVKRVTCIGYADSSGSERTNKALGLKRAKATCAALKLSKRVHAKVVSLGEGSPVASNRTDKGRALNRRTTVTLRY